MTEIEQPIAGMRTITVMPVIPLLNGVRSGFSGPRRTRGWIPASKTSYWRLAEVPGQLGDKRSSLIIVRVP